MAARCWNSRKRRTAGSGGFAPRNYTPSRAPRGSGGSSSSRPCRGTARRATGRCRDLPGPSRRRTVRPGHDGRGSVVDRPLVAARYDHHRTVLHVDMSIMMPSASRRPSLLRQLRRSLLPTRYDRSRGPSRRSHQARGSILKRGPECSLVSPPRSTRQRQCVLLRQSVCVGLPPSGGHRRIAWA